MDEDPQKISEKIAVINNTLEIKFNDLNRRLDERDAQNRREHQKLFESHNKMPSILAQLKIQWWGIGIILMSLASLAFIAIR